MPPAQVLSTYQYKNENPMDFKINQSTQTSCYETTEQYYLQYRTCQEKDIDQLQELHESWFPIRYNQAFYEGAAKGYWLETGRPLFTRVAVLQSYSNSMESLIGAVTASSLFIDKIEDKGLLDTNMQVSIYSNETKTPILQSVHTEVMYVLTLGCIDTYRRQGIASTLLHDCIQEAQRNPSIGAVYLHVKADNISARKFYEKNGFQNLRLLENYYTINGQHYDAYLYILYINGAQAPRSWLDILSRPFMTILTLASVLSEKLLAFGFETTEYKDTNLGEIEVDSTDIV